MKIPSKINYKKRIDEIIHKEKYSMKCLYEKKSILYYNIIFEKTISDDFDNLNQLLKVYFYPKYKKEYQNKLLSILLKEGNVSYKIIPYFNIPYNFITNYNRKYCFSVIKNSMKDIKIFKKVRNIPLFFDYHMGGSMKEYQKIVKAIFVKYKISKFF